MVNCSICGEAHPKGECVFFHKIDEKLDFVTSQSDAIKKQLDSQAQEILVLLQRTANLHLEPNNGAQAFASNQDATMDDKDPDDSYDCAAEAYQGFKAGRDPPNHQPQPQDMDSAMGNFQKFFRQMSESLATKPSLSSVAPAP